LLLGPFGPVAGLLGDGPGLVRTSHGSIYRLIVAPLVGQLGCFLAQFGDFLRLAGALRGLLGPLSRLLGQVAGLLGQLAGKVGVLAIRGRGFGGIAGASRPGASHLRASHLRASHLRASHLRASHLRASHLRASHLRASRTGARHLGFGVVRVLEASVSRLQESLVGVGRRLAAVLPGTAGHTVGFAGLSHALADGGLAGLVLGHDRFFPGEAARVCSPW
jgi:hypothetical protein